jgi:hypothetical protein
MPLQPMLLAELTLPDERDPNARPLERLTEHFALCPGPERPTPAAHHDAAPEHGKGAKSLCRNARRVAPSPMWSFL